MKGVHMDERGNGLVAPGLDRLVKRADHLIVQDRFFSSWLSGVLLITAEKE